MKFFVGIVGLVLLFATLWDAFETIILPRRVTRPVSVMVRVFYQRHLGDLGGWEPAVPVRESCARRTLSYLRPAFACWCLFATWALHADRRVRPACAGRLDPSVDDVRWAGIDVPEPILYLSGSDFLYAGAGRRRSAHDRWRA